tara:strand:- start:87 stop:782 length:696 start_codon:yes stop_codon:yes gene_type:complete
MAILDKGHDFSDGDQVTAAKLDSAVDSATFAAGSVDNASTQLSGGAIVVKDSGVTAAKLADDSVTTSKILDANVTTSKLADDSVTTAKILDDNITLLKLATTLKDSLYPIGSIYTNAVSADNPSTLIGFGTWVEFGAGKVIVGIDSGDVDFDTAEETGGSKTHTLTTSEMPSHSHAYTNPRIGGSPNSGIGTSASMNYPTINAGTTTSTGSDQAHNNLQPYIVVYMWKRTA